MKRFLLAILSVCCATLVYAQKPTQDVLYLKNGSVIKGVVLPSAQGTTKIQTRDGSVFVYDSDDVESVKSEQITHTTTGKKILDFPKHSFGVRAGGLYTLLDDYGYKNHSAGVHLGGIYEVSLTKTNRWFFSTGLDFQYTRLLKKESILVEYDNCMWAFRNVTGNTICLDVPMMISCKFPINDNFTIYPSFGLSHMIGLYSCITGELENKD